MKFLYLTISILSTFAFINGKDLENLITNKFKQRSHTTSTIALENLLHAEMELTENLSEYVAELRQQHKLVKQALTIWESDHAPLKGDYQTHLSNPLNAFKLIRRLYEDAPSWIQQMSSTVGETQIDFAKEMRTTLPSAQDLADACRAIDLIYEYYQLKIEDIASGLLPGTSYPQFVLTLFSDYMKIHSGSSMSSLDCFAMGKYSRKYSKFKKAADWFNASLVHYNPDNKKLYGIYGFSVAKIKQMLGESLLRENQVEASLPLLEGSYLKLEYEELITMQGNCSAGFNRPSHLSCFYKNTLSSNPFLLIAPLKVEMLSVDPHIALYHDVIYDNEITQLYQNIKKKELMLSLVADSRYHALRTSNDIALDDKYLNVILDRRLSDMTDLSMKNSEPLTLQNHGIGGQYHLHYDFWNTTGEAYSKYGDRKATALFYLSDVESGGGTTFPYLNLTVTPKKGSALIWHNLDNAGNAHPKSFHAACPVIVGAKYVIVKWINTNSQMFLDPCKKGFVQKS